MRKMLPVMFLFILTIAAESYAQGVQVSYQLPVERPLPRTYRVTLAITRVDDSDWVVSTFLNGAVRIVTEENQGRFTETWDGLDDNYMPVPPGSYGVKGIYMPARRWKMTGDYHSLIPHYKIGVGDSWMPDPDNDHKLPWVKGHTFGPPMAVGTTSDGMAGFYFSYIENTTNPFKVDLTRPIGYDQVLARYDSWAAAGGWAIATDGDLLWCVSSNGGIQFVYRADRARFGDGRGRWRRDVYNPKGHVTSMAAWRDDNTGQRFLYLTQRGRLVRNERDHDVEQMDDPVNSILVLNGENADELAESAINHPREVMISHDGTRLFVLHQNEGEAWAISTIALQDGLPHGNWSQLFTITGVDNPQYGARDSQGNFYVVDSQANQVYRLDNEGNVAKAFGNSTSPQPGKYDEQSFINPHSIAAWTDAEGNDRLIVVERSLVRRFSEWSPEGELIRQWFFSPNPQMSNGFAIDPENPSHVYATDPLGLVRAEVDYETGEWKLDAIWPDIRGGLHPRIINHNGDKFIAMAGGTGGHFRLYRKDGDNWLASAGIVTVDNRNYLWTDFNGDGQISEEEYIDNPTTLPLIPYWGAQWFDDLSMVLFRFGTPNIVQVSPISFTEHGNPIYDGAQVETLLTDQVYAVKAAGEIDPLFGGNEIGDRFDVDWSKVFRCPTGDIYVNAMSGAMREGVRSYETAGNRAAQVKLIRYTPTGDGGYRIRWRVGRKHYGNHVLKPGEVYGTMHVTPPVGGIVGWHDANGLYHLYTDDGLYVDTLMISGQRPGYTVRGHVPDKGGVYLHGGEFWTNSTHFAVGGKVYVAMGRDTINLYQIEGWMPDGSIVNRIETLPDAVNIPQQQIAPARVEALRLRGLE